MPYFLYKQQEMQIQFIYNAPSRDFSIHRKRKRMIPIGTIRFEHKGLILVETKNFLLSN